MKDLIILGSHGLIDRLDKKSKGENLPEGQGINPQRYNGFKSQFDNFGIVRASDFINAYSNGDIPIFSIQNNLEPVQTETTLEKEGTKILMISGFDPENRRATREDLERITTVASRLSSQGKADILINSPKATLSEDKISAIKIREETGIKVPRTYHVTTFEEAKYLCKQEGKDLVLKQRWGDGGLDVRKINYETINNISHINFNEYILQEEINIASEARMINFGDKFLGSRKIFDRTRPWETRGVRKHQISAYSPTTQEKNETTELFAYLGAELGCIDWIFTNKGERYFLEFNGPAVGFGSNDQPYNLNKLIPKLIKEKYRV